MVVQSFGKQTQLIIPNFLIMQNAKKIQGKRVRGFSERMNELEHMFAEG